jgi:hypothetical protein
MTPDILAQQTADHPRGCRRKAGAEWIHEGGHSYRCSACGDYMIWPDPTEIDDDPILQGEAEAMTETPTPATAGDAGTDRETIKEAMAIVRMQIYAVSTMDEEERRIATPQNQSVWIVRELDKAGLLRRATSAAPAPAGPDRPSREAVLAAMFDLENAVQDWYRRPTSDIYIANYRGALKDLRALIERLTPETGASAGEG